jgi:hypothetical protein
MVNNAEVIARKKKTQQAMSARAAMVRNLLLGWNRYENNVCRYCTDSEGRERFVLRVGTPLVKGKTTSVIIDNYGDPEVWDLIFLAVVNAAGRRGLTIQIFPRGVNYDVRVVPPEGSSLSGFVEPHQGVSALAVYTRFLLDERERSVAIARKNEA